MLISVPLDFISNILIKPALKGIAEILIKFLTVKLELMDRIYRKENTCWAKNTKGRTKMK